MMSLWECLLFFHGWSGNKMKHATIGVASPIFFCCDVPLMDHQRKKGPLTKNTLEHQAELGPTDFFFSPQPLGGKVIFTYMCTKLFLKLACSSLVILFQPTKSPRWPAVFTSTGSILAVPRSTPQPSTGAEGDFTPWATRHKALHRNSLTGNLQPCQKQWKSDT